MPKKPPPAKPPSDVETERIFRDHLLSRYLRVIARGGDMVEIAPRPGHRITFSDEIDGDKRRVRIVVGPMRPAAKDPSTKR